MRPTNSKSVLGEVHMSAVIQRSHLDWLESEAIFILREVAAESEKPVLLFSGGKDSVVLLRLAEKAFRPGRFPFPLMHIDTGHNFDEVIAFRDARAAELGETLIVRSVEDSIARGSVVLRRETDSRNAAQAVTLLEAIEEFGFDACIGGARRDEEKARAKERIFSFRDEFGQWDPKAQRPELWNLFNTRVHRGENMRVFPISNWTELDVWQYIQREQLALPSIYYSHQREVVRRKGLLVPVTRLTPPQDGEQVERLQVRFARWATSPAPASGVGCRRHPGHHCRNRGDRHYRARRHAHGRPDFRGLDGAPQERRLFLIA